MRGAAIFSLLLCLIPNVYSTPVPGALKIMNRYDPHEKAVFPLNPKRVQILHKANKEVKSQLKHMERVLADPEKPAHAAAISKAFGNNPNLEAIKANVKTLKQKTVLIKSVDEPLRAKPGAPIRYAFMKKINGKKYLHFTSKFFEDKTDAGQAGTLLHEISHQLLNTHDNFEEIAPGKFKGIKGTKDKTGRRVLSGYLRKDYETLKEKASPIMHRNADSIKAFGFYAKHGTDTPMN